jgi:hypothetical protein
LGTIISRRRADGSTGYTAQIRLKRDGRIVHSEAETFTTRALAKEWLTRREAALQGQRARGESLGKRMTVTEMVAWYEDRERKEAPLGPNQTLRPGPAQGQPAERPARRRAHPPGFHRPRRTTAKGGRRTGDGRQRPGLAARRAAHRDCRAGRPDADRQSRRSSYLPARRTHHEQVQATRSPAIRRGRTSHPRALRAPRRLGLCDPHARDHALRALDRTTARGNHPDCSGPTWTENAASPSSAT